MSPRANGTLGASIAELGRKGFDTQWARELLEQFEETQTTHIEHRDRLAKELAEKCA
jgi:hypothetical protein